MGRFSPADSGYVEVKDRIEAFYEKYPEGAIRTNIFSMESDLVVVGAECFADRNSELPIGTGFSQMQIPGSTPYTKGSELENAETSAVGRAIAMAGFEVKKSVASSDEIAMRNTDEPEDSGALVEERRLNALRAEVRSLAEANYGPGWKKALVGLGLSVTKRDTEEQLLEAKTELLMLRVAREEDDVEETTDSVHEVADLEGTGDTTVA